MIDVFRPRVRENQQIAWWYVRNTLLFVEETAGELDARLGEPAMADLVHPRMLEKTSRQAHITTRELLGLPSAMLASLEYRLQSLRAPRSSRGFD
jgi:hypothetical protein